LFPKKLPTRLLLPLVLLAASKGYGWDRIVSGAPNITEIVGELGAGGQLVGVGDFCQMSLPKVAGVRMRWEEMLSLRPTRLLLMDSQVEDSGLNLCRALHLPVLSLSFRSLSDIPANTRSIGDFLDLHLKGEAVASAFERRLDTLPRLAPARVIYVLWWNPLRVAGRGSFIGEGLARLGLRTPVEGDGFPQISIEQMAAWEPGLLLYPDDAGPPPKIFVEMGRWRLFSVPGDLWNRPSLAFPRALEGLAHELEK